MKQARALLWVAVGSILILADALAVGPPCVITGPAAVCPGTTNSYSVTPVDGAGYAWFVLGNGGIVGASTDATLVMTSNVPGEIIISNAVWDVNATTNNGCPMAVTNVGVVAVVTSSPGGTDIGGNTNVFCLASSGAVALLAKANPDITDPSQLPDCWTLTGGDVADKLHSSVDQTSAGITEVIATSGNTAATNTVIVLRVDSLTPSPSGTMNGETNVYCIADSGVVTVNALYNPNLLLSHLPVCATLTTEGVGGTVVDKLHATVDLTIKGLTKVIATVGSSSITALVVVVGIESLTKNECTIGGSSAESFAAGSSAPMDASGSGGSTPEPCIIIAGDPNNTFTATTTLDTKCPGCVDWKIEPKDAGEFVSISPDKLTASFKMAECKLPGTMALVYCKIGNEKQFWPVIEGSTTTWDDLPIFPPTCPSNLVGPAVPVNDDCDNSLVVSCETAGTPPFPAYVMRLNGDPISYCPYTCARNIMMYKHTTQGPLRFVGVFHRSRDHNFQCGPNEAGTTCSYDCTTSSCSATPPTGSCTLCPSQEQLNLNNMDGTPVTGEHVGYFHWRIMRYDFRTKTGTHEHGEAPIPAPPPCPPPAPGE